MGSYASLNKLKLSSILVMIMADTLWLILSEKQGIIILWFSPILLHSQGLLQCPWTIWRLTPVPLQRGFQFKRSRNCREFENKADGFSSCFSSYMTHRNVMAGIHLNEALLLPTGEIFAILLSPGNTIILEPRIRHPPTNLKDCLSDQNLFSLKVDYFWQRLRAWFLWKHIGTFTILFTLKKLHE